MRAFLKFILFGLAVTVVIAVAFVLLALCFKLFMESRFVLAVGCLFLAVLTVGTIVIYGARLLP